MTSRVSALTKLVAGAMLIGATTAHAAEIKVITSVAVKEADQIKDKVTQTPSGVQVGEVVARGEADLGFQAVSELLHLKGIHYLGPLPADIQHITVFSAGLHTAAPAPDAAKALTKFLTAPEAAPVIRRSGMDPG